MMPCQLGCCEHLKFIFVQPMQQYKFAVMSSIFWKESISHAQTHLCRYSPCCCPCGWIIKTGGIYMADFMLFKCGITRGEWVFLNIKVNSLGH